MLLSALIDFVEAHLKGTHAEKLTILSQAYLKEPTFKSGLALQRNVKQCLNELAEAGKSYSHHVVMKFGEYGNCDVSANGVGMQQHANAITLLEKKAKITVETTVDYTTHRTTSEVNHFEDVPTIYLKEIFPAVRSMLKSIPSGVIAHMRHFGFLIMVTSDGVMQVSRHDAGQYVAATPWADTYMQPGRCMNLRTWLEMDEILLLALSERALD